MTNRTCHLPLVALRCDETCPRCGRPAREHRGHPSYEETTMDETTEPTREQIERIATMPAAATLAMGRERIDLRILAAMALRTLDAEAKLESSRQVEACSKAFHDLVVKEHDFERVRAARLEEERDVARAKLAATTERAEKAERERHVAVSVMREMRVAWDGASDQRNDLRSKLAESELDALRAKLAAVELVAGLRADTIAAYDSVNADLRAKLSTTHRRAQRAESATADARREAIGQRKRADWWRREAKRIAEVTAELDSRPEISREDAALTSCSLVHRIGYGQAEWDACLRIERALRAHAAGSDKGGLDA